MISSNLGPISHRLATIYPLQTGRRHHFFIPISKLFFFSNLILHSHLAPLRTDSMVIRTCSRFLCLLFSVFFLSFSFHYYSSFLTFSVFFLTLVVFTSFIFRIFVSFTFRTISILSISHFIFPLNISVLFSLCARLN